VRTDPPPEISPNDRAERELLARLAALEGRAAVDVNGPINPATCGESSLEHQLKECIRISRAERKSRERLLAEARAGLPAKRRVWEEARAAILGTRDSVIREAQEACRLSEQTAREAAEADL
jgi:hypothetical protein